MSDLSAAAKGLPLQSLPTTGRWTVLLAASVLGAGLLQWARLPAALLLGPLAGARLGPTGGSAGGGRGEGAPRRRDGAPGGDGLSHRPLDSARHRGRLRQPLARVPRRRG